MSPEEFEKHKQSKKFAEFLDVLTYVLDERDRMKEAEQKKKKQDESVFDGFFS